MATKTLVEKIEALPADKRSEVERFVDHLVGAPTAPSETKPSLSEVVARIRERRERLFKEHGLFTDSTAIIRELRDS